MGASERSGRGPGVEKLWPPCCCRGAELLLWAPVRFQGNLVLAGQLNVKAAGDAGTVNTPYVAVEGNFALRPEARLSIQGCQNEAEEEDVGEGGDEEDDKEHTNEGGCLYVGGDAELLGGQLLLHKCSARRGLGGGIYVAGRTGSCCFDLEKRRLRTLASEEL